MRRNELEHAIRASGSIADDNEIVVIGSQAVLGQFPSAPEELCVSNDVDVYPKNHPERWSLIDGSIGELSPFHQTFGFYVQGVERHTATLPDGWEDRLVRVHNSNTNGVTGWCLEVHDLVISKYVAGREKDREFARAAFRHGIVQQEVLIERLADTPIDVERRDQLRAAIEHDVE